MIDAVLGDHAVATALQDAASHGIVGIVDHERAIYGDPIMEAGLTSIDLEGFDEAEPFMEGYGMTGLTPSEFRRQGRPAT